MRQRPQKSFCRLVFAFAPRYHRRVARVKNLPANRTRSGSDRPNRRGKNGPGQESGRSGPTSDLEVELAVYRQALERSRADMQSFAYSVSHDLRAPLRAIQGFSKILLEDFAAQLDPEAQQFLKHIVQNTQLLGGQMDDLLRFSRAGRQAPVKIDLDTESLAREAIAQVESDLQAKLPVQIAPLPRAYADPVLLRQALVELLGNARKFSRNHPDPRIWISGRSDPSAAIITVADNGVGFDPARAEKLFHVFQKMHGPAEFPGNGIGLAIIRRIVEAHGGCVEAQAAPGQGACFTLSLPHASARLPLDCAPAARPQPAPNSAVQNSA